MIDSSYAIIEFATNALEEEFVWGEKDCVWLAREITRIKTGLDRLADAIPSYSTKGTATKAYNKVVSFEEALEGIGAFEVPLTHVTLGDMVFVRADSNESKTQNMCVYLGRGNVITANEDNTGFQIVKALKNISDDYIAYRVI